MNTAGKGVSPELVSIREIFLYGYFWEENMQQIRHVDDSETVSMSSGCVAFACG